MNFHLRRSLASGLATCALVLSAWSACCTVAVAAAPGVTEDTITFGQSGCFSGVCATVGLQYRVGILAAFHERNRAGGVNGRELRLTWRDDGDEPERAADNANRFVAASDVFAVIGGTGTLTARRILPTLRTANVPFVGHLTGAGFLSDAGRFPNVVNVRTQHSEEIRRLVAYMFDRHGARRFGIIYQDDSFGRSVLNGSENALEALDLSILAKASYSRRTHAVHASVFVMEKADLDAVILAMTASGAADAINTARSLGHGYRHGFLSYVDTARLRSRLDDSTEKFVTTRVTPDVGDRSIALVRRFHRELSAYRMAEPEASELVTDAVALEGYILGRFVVDVLERMPDEVTREAFLATALAPEAVVLDDWVIVFEDGGNVGSDYVRVVDYDTAP